MTTRGTLGSINYKVNDVKGDGHCYYRSLFNIIKKDEDALTALDMGDYIEQIFDKDELFNEDDAIDVLREYISNEVKTNEEAKNMIDNLYNLVKNMDEEDVEELEELYPFIEEIKDVRMKKSRYRKVAEAIRDRKLAMYASSLENDIIFQQLQLTVNIGLVIISVESEKQIKSRKNKLKWMSDLCGYLKSLETERVGVLVNVGNLHYEYMTFKAEDDNEYNGLYNRNKLMRLLNCIIPEEQSGGKRRKRT